MNTRRWVSKIPRDLCRCHEQSARNLSKVLFEERTKLYTRTNHDRSQYMSPRIKMSWEESQGYLWGKVFMCLATQLSWRYVSTNHVLSPVHLTLIIFSSHTVFTVSAFISTDSSSDHQTVRIVPQGPRSSRAACDFALLGWWVLKKNTAVILSFVQDSVQ